MITAIKARQISEKAARRTIKIPMKIEIFAICPEQDIKILKAKKIEKIIKNTAKRTTHRTAFFVHDNIWDPLYSDPFDASDPDTRLARERIKKLANFLRDHGFICTINLVGLYVTASWE